MRVGSNSTPRFLKQLVYILALFAGVQARWLGCLFACKWHALLLAACFSSLLLCRRAAHATIELRMCRCAAETRTLQLNTAPAFVLVVCM
jgi:hypothetical protein